MNRADIARAYYEHIDGDEYEALAEVLTPAFSQERGDRTFQSRESFVRFMREDRPETETVHDVETVYGGDSRVAVEGTLRRDSGETMFHFVDTFGFEGDRIDSLRTYTR